MKILHVLLIAWEFKILIVFGVKKGLIFYKCIYNVLYGVWCETVRYIESKSKTLYMKYKFFIFSSLDSYRSKLHSFQVFVSLITVLLAQSSLLTSSSSCKVELSCRFFIQIPTVIIKLHILVSFVAIDMAKQFYGNLCVGSKCNVFPRHAWRSFENDWWKCCSFGN